MSDEIKDYFLALNGKCISPQDLKIDHNYKIETDIIIDSRNLKSNAGSKNMHITGQLDGTAKIINDQGQIMLAETTKSQSKLLRNQIFHLGRDYEDDMRILRHLYDTVIVDAIDKHKRGENV